MLIADTVLLSDKLLPVRSDFSGEPLPDLLAPPPSITAAAALQSSTHPWTSRSRCCLASVAGLTVRGSSGCSCDAGWSLKGSLYVDRLSGPPAAEAAYSLA